MVLSNINQQVNYIEKKTIDPEDIGHESWFYEVEILDVPIVIVLGKQKYTFSSKDIIYYPIYIVEDDTIKAQIGVFESFIKNTINLVDNEGGIDISKMGEPLIYSFVTKKFLLKTNSNPKKYLDNDNDESKKMEQHEHEETAVIEIDSSDDEMDVMKIKVAKNKISEEKQKTDKIIEKGIFTIEPNFKHPPLLIEETESDSDKIKMDYKESSTNNWLQKFLKNNHYDILENEGQGDCFFAVLRDAFKEIGQKTTVDKLRTLLASQLTDSVYQEQRVLYDNFETEKNEYEKKLKDLKNTNQILKNRAKKIADNTTDMEKYKDNMDQLKETLHLQSEYVGFMKNIHSMEDFRNYITTSQFWADAWSISTLETLLKIKVIILSEESYKEKEFDNILNCGEVNEAQQMTESAFEPNHYIIAAYNGTHYRLVSYKKRGILTFHELPYDIKILIVNKCLEKNAGIFYLIQDFRNFKTKLGLDPDEGNPREEEEDENEEAMTLSHLFNKSVVFVYNSKSLDAKPGKGSNEIIPKNSVGDFMTLSKNKHWRRKLDDLWSDSPFSLDKMRWVSVEHYIQGAKFKKGFPDFYSQFSVDNPSELSKDSELARKVGYLSKAKNKDMRPKGLKIDPDYSLGRNKVEREAALRAKFTENEDLKELLLATQDAFLKKSIRRKPAEADYPLMKIRGELKHAKMNGV